MTIQFNITRLGDDSVVTIFDPSLNGPLVGHSTHPGFQPVVDGLLDGTLTIEAAIDLLDVEKAVAEKFDRLSDRVSVANGKVYLDGDEVHSSLSDQIIRFLEEGQSDWQPLVRFFEKVQANPSEHSREQLYEWLARRDFTIDTDGNLVGYKGVQPSADGGYESINRGPAIVDGQAVNGNVPNNVGSVVEIARSAVHADASVGCSSGLHVGEWGYAASFARGAVLEVRVNPRDVVSVPTDCDAAKVRVCRYVITGVTEVAYTEAVVDGYDDWDDDWDDDYDDGEDY